MKLSKTISCLVPISLIGVTTPILTSCGGQKYTFEYADNINCFDKEIKEVAYHELKDVQNAAKLHVEQYPEGTKKTVIGVNSDPKRTLQQMYFDLVAGVTVTEGCGLLLQVEYTEETKAKQFDTLSFDRSYPTKANYTNVTIDNLKYDWNSTTNHFVIKIDQNVEICQSYLYANCTLES